MDLNLYRFTSVWRLDAPPDSVYEALRDVECYPRWWPAIRHIRQTGEHSGEATVRSFLPYALVFTLSESRQDPVAGVLEATMTGDLDGWSRWTVRADAGVSYAVFEEEATTTRPLMRWLALPARPIFRANHAMMMHSGERGLRRYLAAL